MNEEHKSINKRIKLTHKQLDNDNLFRKSVDANYVAQYCYAAYKLLGKSGKPDLNKEHTVLAGIVEINHKLNSETKVVALATGTKCFPKNVETRFTDIVDCHAESLLKRAFKRYLIELAKKWNDNRKLSENLPDIFYNEVVQHREFILFISQTPCGCVSRWKGDLSDHSSDQSVHKESTNKGLRQYKLVGINRKPGKGNLCHKAGCIHKIAKWNIFGLQGASLIWLTKNPICPSQIVIGNCESNEGEFQYSEIISRFTVDPEEYNLIENQISYRDKYKINHLKPISVQFADKFRYKEFLREDGIPKKPAGSSIVAWLKNVKLSSELKITANKSIPLHCEIVASGRRLGAVSTNKCKEKASLSSGKNETNTKDLSNKHSNDLMICDRAIHRDIELLFTEFGQKLDNKEIKMNPDKAIQTPKNHDSNINLPRIIYQHNWDIVKSNISIFKGWPTMDA